MGLTVINLMKQVPVPSEMRIDPATGLMDRTKARSQINTDCHFALEAGLQIKDAGGGEAVVVSMGPPSFEQSHREAMGMGFDRSILLSDRKLAGSDTYATGKALGTLLMKLGFTSDASEPWIVCAGRQTTDGDTAHVPSQVAETVGIPQVTYVEKIEYAGDHLRCRRIIEGGYQWVKVPIPCMVSVSPTHAPPRGPNIKYKIKAKKAELEIYDVEYLGLTAEQVGLAGSPTIVAKTVNVERERPPVTFAEGETAGAMVKSMVDLVNNPPAPGGSD